MRGMKIFFLSMIIFRAGIFFAQVEYDTVVVRDLESWTSANAKFKIGNFSFSIGQQLRMKENSSALNQIFTQLEAKYKLPKGFSVGSGYRFIFDKKKEGFTSYRRWNLDAGYKNDFGQFDFNSRIRYQRKWEKNSELLLPKDNVFRIKVGATYKIKDWKLDPNFSSELFRIFGKEVDSEFSKIRFTIGTDYKFNKHHSLGGFYRIEKDLNVTYPQTNYILGLKYTYSLNLRNNEKSISN